MAVRAKPFESGFILRFMPEQIQSGIELGQRLAEVLVKWPLYRTYSYIPKQCHYSESGPYGQVLRYAQLPLEIRTFCNHSKCGYETIWELPEAKVYFKSEFINRKTYTCRNCGSSTVHYCLIWQEREAASIFLKIGQFPELEERINEALEKGLNKSDLRLYKNALRMRNFNLGVAAVAHMRRIIENRMNDMLEILHESAVAHNAPPELLASHDAMKKEKRFSEKIDYAGELLPISLRPPGKPNPMAILHELASDGLHAKSDEQCVDIFDSCRRTFEYVFGKLRIETEDARNFVKEMANLAEKKNKGTADAIKQQGTS
jgi:hypothetical protein